MFWLFLAGFNTIGLVLSVRLGDEALIVGCLLGVIGSLSLFFNSD